MKKKYFIIFSICVLSFLTMHIFLISRDAPQKSFVSDGCSVWPDRNYYDCCYKHDKAYWDAGTQDDRQNADLTFRQCMTKSTNEFYSHMMYLGVRIGGHPIWPTPWRWDFGRPYSWGYKTSPDNQIEKP